MASVFQLVAASVTVLLLAGAVVDDACLNSTTACYAVVAPAVALQAPTAATLAAVRDSVLADTVVVTIRPVGNELKYDTTEIRAKAGTTLTIILENTSTVFLHNVVVFKRAEDIESVGNAALTAVEDDYVPVEHRDKLVAFTSTTAPGKKSEVTFTVPPPGEYPYVCTFPGHYVLMKGTLISEE